MTVASSVSGILGEDDYAHVLDSYVDLIPSESGEAVEPIPAIPANYAQQYEKQRLSRMSIQPPAHLQQQQYSLSKRQSVTISSNVPTTATSLNLPPSWHQETPQSLSQSAENKSSVKESVAGKQANPTKNQKGIKKIKSRRDLALEATLAQLNHSTKGSTVNGLKSYKSASDLKDRTSTATSNRLTKTKSQARIYTSSTSAGAPALPIVSLLKAGNRHTKRDSPSTYGTSYKQVLESAMELEFSLSSHTKPLPYRINGSAENNVKGDLDSDQDFSALLVPYELPDKENTQKTTTKSNMQNEKTPTLSYKSITPATTITPVKNDSFDPSQKRRPENVDNESGHIELTPYFGEFSNYDVIDFDVSTSNQTFKNQINPPITPQQYHNHQQQQQQKQQHTPLKSPGTSSHGLVSPNIFGSMSSNGGRTDSLRQIASQAMMRAGMGSAAIRLAQVSLNNNVDAVDFNRKKSSTSNGVAMSTSSPPLKSGNKLSNSPAGPLIMSNYTDVTYPPSNTQQQGDEDDDDYDEGDEHNRTEVSQIDEYGFMVPKSTLINKQATLQTPLYQNGITNNNNNGGGYPIVSRRRGRLGSSSTQNTSLSTIQQLARPLTRSGPTTYTETYKIQKWRTLLATFDVKTIRRSRKVKQLVQAGFPRYLRGSIYKFLMDLPSYRKDGVFKSLLERPSIPIYEIIERDIPRCYPEHSMFRRSKGQGQTQLRRILQAYSQYNPEVGYCQGMGRLVGLCLMQGIDEEEEEEAFWMLVSIIDQYLPGYYSPKMEQLRVHATVFEMLLRDHNPKLYNHLTQQDCSPLMYITPWFMTVFTMTLPWPTVLRVWDWFVFRGNKVLFRVGLAILDLVSDHLLENCPSLDTQLSFLLHLPADMVQEEDLISAALRIRLTSKRIEDYIKIVTRGGIPDRGAPPILPK